jgi:hypothetical protein
MIVLLVKEIIRNGKLWLWIPFTLLMVGFALKSNDLWGKELSSVINEMGLLGLSNLAFIVFYGVMRQRSLSVQQLEVN